MKSQEVEISFLSLLLKSQVVQVKISVGMCVGVILGSSATWGKMYYTQNVVVMETAAGHDCSDYRLKCYVCIVAVDDEEPVGSSSTV